MGGLRTICVLLASLHLFAVTSFAATTGSLEELKLQKRFGVGVSVGGPLAIMGISVDVNLTDQFSVTGGYGTGLEYSTLMLEGKYYLLGKSVSPYFGLGLARWWTSGTNATSVGPGLLMNNFLDAGTNLNHGFSVFSVYPAFGVQYLHPSGFALSAEFEYLFKLIDFANGAYAGLSAHWYF
jgi:hypothetical protein